MKPEQELIQKLAESCKMEFIGPTKARTPEEIRVDAELRRIYRVETTEIDR